jgi:CTP:molybdopterin cytidylyltransferase MocA
MALHQALPGILASGANEPTASGKPGPDASVPVYEGRGGPPVLLNASTIRHLLGRPAETRLDAELSLLNVARVPVQDPRVRLNLNAPLDWVKVKVRSLAYGSDPGYRRRS